jgi:hypothetical protein
MRKIDTPRRPILSAHFDVRHYGHTVRHLAVRRRCHGGVAATVQPFEFRKLRAGLTSAFVANVIPRENTRWQLSDPCLNYEKHRSQADIADSGGAGHPPIPRAIAHHTAPRPNREHDSLLFDQQSTRMTSRRELRRTLQRVRYLSLMPRSRVANQAHVCVRKSCCARWLYTIHRMFRVHEWSTSLLQNRD